MLQHTLCIFLMNNINCSLVKYEVVPMIVWGVPVLTGTDANATQCFYIGLLPSIFWKKAFILPGRRPHVHANAASFQTGSSGLVKLVCLTVVTRERVQKKNRLCSVQTLASGISFLKLKQTTQQGYWSRHNLSETWKSQNNSCRLPDTEFSGGTCERKPQRAEPHSGPSSSSTNCSSWQQKAPKLDWPAPLVTTSLGLLRAPSPLVVYAATVME